MMKGITSEVISCGHCGNISYMEIIGTVRDTEFRGTDEYHEEIGTIYNLLKCPACKEVNIISYFWYDSMDSNDTEGKLIYPQDRDFPTGLPESILTSIKAAEKVRVVDANAYTLLLGRTLELVCHDRNAEGKSLFAMLEFLSKKGEIPEKLINVANGLRHFRNIGAHAGIGSLTSNDLPIVKSLCYAILEYIYSAPYLSSLAENNLTKIKNKSTK